MSTIDTNIYGNTLAKGIISVIIIILKIINEVWKETDLTPGSLKSRLRRAVCVGQRAQGSVRRAACAGQRAQGSVRRAVFLLVRKRKWHGGVTNPLTTPPSGHY